MTGCPSAEQLEQLLSESLNGDESRHVSEHVSACMQCQTALERLTSGGEITQHDSPASQSSVVEFEPALTALLARMREVPPELRPPADAAPSPKHSTDQVRFPEPPTPNAPLGRLGSYEVLERVGSGANGVLFKARDAKLGRIVALKVLRRELATIETARARFEREARAAASLNHDNVVTVYDVGAPADFPPYLVMEYIAGEPLNARLKRETTLDPREAVRIVQQVALGLAAAHERGLVHRDIKPSNIMLDSHVAASQPASPNDCRAKITDFGLARGPEVGAPITREGAIAGTPAYMSPEQLTSPQNVDSRSDIYSLGVVLYELLTGEVPFRGMVRMILWQVVNEEPRPPSRVNDKVPADVETMCLKAMAKEPARRYANAAEFAADLRRWLAGEPIRARPSGTVERFWRWSKRNPLIARLSAAVAVLLFAVTVGSAIAALRLRAASIQTEDALLSERRSRYDAEAANRDAGAATRRAEAVQRQEQKLRKEAELKRDEVDTAADELQKSLDAERQARLDLESRLRKALESLLRAHEAGLPNDLQLAGEPHVASLVAAAQAAIALAADRDTTKDRGEQLRSHALEQLRAAVRLDPENPQGWLWRELLARQLLVASKARIDDSARAALRQEARELLSAASAVAPAERRDELQRQLHEIESP